MMQRRRRIARLIAVGAIAAVPMVSGCSAAVSSSRTTGSTPLNARQPPMDAHRGDGTGSPDLVQPATLDLHKVTAAVSAERYVRIDGAIAVDGGQAGPISMTSTSVFDTTNGDLETTGSLHAKAIEGLGLDLSNFSLRKVGPKMYFRTSASAKWIKIDLGSMAARALPVPTDAKSILDDFASTGVVLTKQGTVTRNGETLTRYVGTVDVDGLLAKMKNGTEFAGQLPAGARGVRGQATVLVTADGAPRHVEVQTTSASGDIGKVTITADYVKVTATPDLSAPPASQVTDLATGLSSMTDGGN